MVGSSQQVSRNTTVVKTIVYVSYSQIQQHVYTLQAIQTI
jgi:hypothetical protein